MDGPVVLGVETSCDETAAAVVTVDPAIGGGRILGQALLSQIDEHRPYGGVVPEIAARSHLAHLDGLVKGALAQAGLAIGAVDAVAATCGPGLIGGVIVGAMTAKAMAFALGRPFLPVNHLEGHVLTARLTDGIAFPYLVLLVSGGHCQLVAVAGVGVCRRLGTTIDDAAGEAFDKVAKMLGLGYPGGPAVEAWARRGDPRRFALPRPLVGRPGCDFSFSGLKTAVRQTIESLAGGAEAGAGGMTGDDSATGAARDQVRADLAAAFQAAVGECLADRSRRAMARFAADHGPGRPFVVAGGVAANRALRARLSAVAAEAGMPFVAPPPALCTDNAAMIAWAGLERLRLGETGSLAFRPRPRWPLDEVTPPGAAGGG